MANQTITTAVNYDDAAIAGLLNGETITNNGGSLTVNSDVRWNQQAAVMGNITCSSVLGGSVLIDGTTVWELTFTASTGNVPTQGALGTNGVTGGTSGATGELLRVWQTGFLTPITTGGGAMPATGWIKLRSKTGTFIAGEIVTLPGGATITIADAGKRSWLHIVGGENLQITSARVSGTCSMTGDWYQLGTTNGTDDQTFQFPVADYCPAIQVETAVGNGTYEWWLYADNRWGTATQYVATDVRGKYFGMDPATGVITIARRATNPCGFKPVSGLRVRIPNLICSSSSSANWNANTFSATVGLRYKGVNVSNVSGSALYDKICNNWDIITSSGRDLTITSCASMALRSIGSMLGQVTITDVGIGCLPVVTFTAAATMLVVSACNNLIMTDVRVVKRENDFSNDVPVSLSTTFCTVTRLQAEMFGTTGSVIRATGTSTSVLSASRCYDSVFNDTTVIGAGISANTFVGTATFNGISFADNLVGSTQTTGTTVAACTITTSTGMVVNGPFAWFGNLSNVQPFAQIFIITSACRNIIIQNIGSSATPLNCNNNAQSLFTIGDTDNAIIRRCYVQNTRISNIGTLSLTATNITIDNCASDYADATSITGARCKWRGVKTGLGSATAQNFGTNVADLFTSATAGRIVFTGNDPSPTSPQLVIAGGVGAATSGAGAVILPNLNDTATWETPWFILGHTALANSALTLTGTNTGNFAYDFQYDIGTGWNGTWLSATGANLSGIGAINPAVGIKLKMRATTTVANATNAIQLISVITVTTASAQDTLYPFPFDATGTVSNLQAGSRVQIYNQTTATEIANESVAGTSYSLSYYNGTGISAGDTVRIRIAKLGYLPQTLLAIATATGFSATANQQVDSIYVANGIDGSTITEFTADYPNVQMDITDVDGVTTVQRVYAWLRFNETSSQGIALWFDGVTPTDQVNYLIDTTILNMQLDNQNTTPVQIIGGRLYRSDDTTIIAPLSNSIQMDPFRVYLGDGISPNETTYNNLADTFLRRSTANVEASSFGDPLSLRSMYGMVAQGTHNTYVDNNNKLIVTKSDEVTQLGTRTITNSPLALPITGLDSD